MQKELLINARRLRNQRESRIKILVEKNLEILCIATLERSEAIFDPPKVLRVSASLFRFITFKRSETSSMMYELARLFSFIASNVPRSRGAHFLSRKMPVAKCRTFNGSPEEASIHDITQWIWLRSNMSISVYINMDVHRETYRSRQRYTC